MASRYVTTQQYEPLRTPPNWNQDERRLLQQFTDRFDELYSKFNRLKFTDFGTELKSIIESKVTDGEFQSYVTQTAQEIASKVSSSDYESYISQTAELIAAKVASADFQSYVTQTATEIASKVKTTDYESYKTQTATEIAAKVADSVYQSFVSQTATAIASKVSTTDYESYKTQTATEIASKVTNSDYQTYITQTATAIASKASQADLTTLDGRVSTAESAIEQTPTQITAAVSNVKIGGTNKFRVSSELSCAAGHAFTHDDTIHGVYIASSIAAPAGTFRIADVIDENGDWTISFYIRGNAAMDSAFYVNVDVCDMTAKTVYLPATPEERKYVALTFTGLTYADASYNYVDFSTAQYGEFYIEELMIEHGNKASARSPSPLDPAPGVKTSYFKMLQDLIEVYSGGIINILAGAAFNLRAGSGANSIGISNDEAANYFLWAGNASPASAPFSVKKDGTTKATTLILGNSQIANITNVYAEHFADNADFDHPLVCDVYVPSDISRISQCLLSVRFEAFRAYETGAAAGGGQTKTSSSGGGGSVTSGQSAGYATASTSDASVGSSSWSGTTGADAGSGVHSHSIPSHSHNVTVSGHYHFISGHTHDVSFGSHSHTITLENHTHEIAYGIHEGTTCTSVNLYVDGVWYLANASVATLTKYDIASLFSKTGATVTRDAWHTITLVPNTLTRLVANLFMKTIVSTVSGAL